MPLLEETGYIPSQRYADGSEIFEHAQRIGRHYDLYDKTYFQTRATHAQWDEQAQRWEVTTDRGDRFRTRVLMRSNGALTKPQLPKVPGIADFEGKIFHTSRWDYDYTGGSAAGNLENLRDKRVAVVGTGATGVQVVPYLGEDAKELIVVQRTPSVVQPRNNRKTDPRWAESLQPGWQYERHDNFNGIISGHEVDGNLVDDGWTHLFPQLTGQPLVDTPVGELPEADQALVAELADMKLLMGAHQRVDSIVTDPATADGLKPWFGYMCKRPCFNDEYLQTFNRPNVTLAASPTGIDGITSTGIVVAGTHYEVDCIIFATGFETGSGPAGIYGYDVIGCEGHSMQEYFSEAARTFHGFFTHGFRTSSSWGCRRPPTTSTSSTCSTARPGTPLGWSSTCWTTISALSSRRPRPRPTGSPRCAGPTSRARRTGVGALRGTTTGRARCPRPCSATCTTRRRSTSGT